MNTYFAIAVVCFLYFGAFFYMLQFGLGMYALGSFFGIFLFLGLGGVEFMIKILSRKQT